MITPTGNRTTKACDPPELAVGPFRLGKCGPIILADFSPEREATGKPIIGCLGVSALKDTVLQIDYDNREFRFLRSDSAEHPAWVSRAAIHVSPDMGTPVLGLTVEKTEQALQIDTGDDGFAALPSKTFGILSRNSKFTVSSGQVTAAAGTTALRSIRGVVLNLGGLDFPGRIVNETKQPVGAVGLGFLERGQATIDFPNHAFYFKPGKQFNRPAEEAMSGMRLVRVGSKLVVNSVDPESPAEGAGFQRGDVLIELDGKAPTDWNIYDLRAMFTSDEGREMSVTIRRGKAKILMRFKLHKVN